MRLPRLLVPVLLATALSLAACGGGSSGGGTSAGSTKASGGAGGGGKASDAAFCQVFTDAGRTLEDAASAGDAKSKINDFADKMESTAPSDIKGDAKTLADAYRSIAGNISNGKTPPSFSADVTKAVTAIVVWTTTHCSFAHPSVAVPSFSAPSFSIPSFSVPSFSVPSFSLPSISLPSSS